MEPPYIFKNAWIEVNEKLGSGNKTEFMD